MPQYQEFLFDNVAAVAESASFEVRLPQYIPNGYELRLLRNLWPPHIDEAGMLAKVPADFVDAIYTDDDGHHLLVTQGYLARFIGIVWAGMAPGDVGGTTTLGSREAVWLTARPTSHPVVDADGTRRIEEWDRSPFVCIGWEDAVVAPPDGGAGASHRYYSIESTALSLDEITRIASSVS